MFIQENMPSRKSRSGDALVITGREAQQVLLVAFKFVLYPRSEDLHHMGGRCPSWA